MKRQKEAAEKKRAALQEEAMVAHKALRVAVSVTMLAADKAIRAAKKADGKEEGATGAEIIGAVVHALVTEVDESQR